jgi:hypothetical protein
LVEHREVLNHERDEAEFRFYSFRQEFQDLSIHPFPHDAGDYDQQSKEEMNRKAHEIMEKTNRTMEKLLTCYKENQCNKTGLREMVHALSSLSSQWHEDLARLRNAGNHGVPFVDLSDTNGYKIVL